MTALHVRLLPFALACLLTALAMPAQSGSPEAPEVEDPAGDVQVSPLDIKAVWFEVTDSAILVHIQRADGADSPEPHVACNDGQCVGEGVALRAVFAVLRPDGTPSPAIEGYNASYVLVRLGVPDADMAAIAGHMDADGVFVASGPVNATVDGVSVVVTLPRDSEVVAMPSGPTPGAYRLADPWAYSAPMACVVNEGQPAPAPAGCVTLKNQRPGAPGTVPTSTADWDRAPDAEFGADFVFPSPPPPAPQAPAAKAKADAGPASATTVTVVQKEVKTMTVTETATFTHTPLPLVSDAKGTPGLGLVAVVGALAVGLLAMRRRLA